MRLEIIAEVTGQIRDRLYVFEQYFNLFEALSRTKEAD